MDWPAIRADLDSYGCAVVPRLLDPAACLALRDLYPRDDLFRSRIVMARHGFGQGEYKYFQYPLPDMVAELRGALYPGLAGIANAWNESLGDSARFPPTHAAYLKLCHDAGQTKPTPLLLSYGAGDYNCLHQDLYGPLAFPLQVAVLLSAPGDFTGGEFVLTEQRPRRQSRAEVVPLGQGDAVVPGQPPAGPRGAWGLSGDHAPWGQPRALGRPPDAGHHLPRRRMTRPGLSPNGGRGLAPAPAPLPPFAQFAPVVPPVQPRRDPAGAVGPVCQTFGP